MRKVPLKHALAFFFGHHRLMDCGEADPARGEHAELAALLTAVLQEGTGVLKVIATHHTTQNSLRRDGAACACDDECDECEEEAATNE